MSDSTPLDLDARPWRANLRAFVIAFAVGAAFALGIRSLLHDPSEGAHAAHASAASAAPGGRRHAADPAPATPEAGPASPSDPTTGPAAQPGAVHGGTGLLIDLGNANCPVMQGEVNGEVFSEWNGLRVGHCCPPCSERFLKNPEALLDEVSPGWREALEAVGRVRAARGEERERALADLRERWTVIREPAAAPEDR